MELRVDVWSTYDAVYPGFGPPDCNMRVGGCRAGASCPPAPSRRRPTARGRAGPARLVQISRVAADPAVGEQESRSLQFRRRL